MSLSRGSLAVLAKLRGYQKHRHVFEHTLLCFSVASCLNFRGYFGAPDRKLPYADGAIGTGIAVGGGILVVAGIGIATGGLIFPIAMAIAAIFLLGGALMRFLPG